MREFESLQWCTKVPGQIDFTFYISKAVYRRDKKIVKHRAMTKRTNNTKFLFENLVSNNIYLTRYISI